MMMRMKKEVVGENSDRRRAEEFGMKALWFCLMQIPRFIFGTIPATLMQGIAMAVTATLGRIPPRLRSGIVAILIVACGWFIQHKDTTYRVELAKLCPEYAIETTMPWGLRLIELRGQSILAYAGKGCKIMLSAEDRERLASTERKLTSMAVELAGVKTPEALQARFKEQDIEVSGYTGSHIASMEMALMKLMVVVEGMGLDPYVLDRAEKRTQEAKAQEAEAARVAAVTPKPTTPAEFAASPAKPPAPDDKKKPTTVTTVKSAKAITPPVQNKPGKLSPHTETAVAKKKGSGNIDQAAIDKGRAALAAMRSGSPAKTGTRATQANVSSVTDRVARR